MADVISTIGEGFKQSFLMAYEVWWALVLGFAISAIVQSWVPRERVEAALAGSGPGPIAKATGLGAASSSCSYAAVAIARSVFRKGANFTAAMAFEMASTNLVLELSIIIVVLMKPVLLAVLVLVVSEHISVLSFFLSSLKVWVSYSCSSKTRSSPSIEFFSFPWPSFPLSDRITDRNLPSLSFFGSPIIPFGPMIP